jgi:hypothetical protein
MSKQAAAVIALGLAGTIITLAFIFVFLELHLVGWAIASLCSGFLTITGLRSCAKAPESCKGCSKKEE